MTLPPPSTQPRTASFAQMTGYAVGEGANSLVLNGIFGFAMLFYTKSLGLSPIWASLAMSVAIFWEAISEPAMGHISDNTRSRWGRRHPYMVVGGVGMALLSYMIWAVPGIFRGSQLDLFWYLVVINLLLRTGLTMFFIPYMALGFEICTDYQGRSKLQGLRYVFNMIANFAGPGLAWIIFFQDKNGVQATTVASNYQWMGAAFAIATVICAGLSILWTFKWHEDTRNAPRHAEGSGLMGFFRDMKNIVLDPNPRWVFIFTLVVNVGTCLVACLQMFVYDDFMRFSGTEKSIAHGGSMVGFAIGAAIAPWLARLLDKKGAVLLGAVLSVVCNVMLAVLFSTGLVSTHAHWLVGGVDVPVSLILFVVFHISYWLGNGILVPISTAMMADVAELNLLRTGENKDGGYASVFSFAIRLATAIGLSAAGWVLTWTGYKTISDTASNAPIVQTPQALWNLGMAMFMIGAVIAGIACLTILKYPISRQYLENMRKRGPAPA